MQFNPGICDVICYKQQGQCVSHTCIDELYFAHICVNLLVEHLQERKKKECVLFFMSIVNSFMSIYI